MQKRLFILLLLTAFSYKTFGGYMWLFERQIAIEVIDAPFKDTPESDSNEDNEASEEDDDFVVYLLSPIELDLYLYSTKKLEKVHNQQSLIVADCYISSPPPEQRTVS